MGNKLTTAEVARLTGRTNVSIYSLLKRGVIKGERKGKTILIDEREIIKIPKKSKAGKPIGSGKVKGLEECHRITVYLDKLLAEKVQNAVNTEKTTVSAFFRQLAETHFEQNGPK
ncbi:MAG: helix-turn-helix domain-containing protein [Blastocatellia bacterium]|nr:helix-turn-helix domain-containing protein [Blastocatellia bacterium]